MLREIQWQEFEMFVVQFALLGSRGNQTQARKEIYWFCTGGLGLVLCQAVRKQSVCCFPALPQAPTVSCSPTGYVPENSTLSCTCNTATLGQPTGRLRWFGGTGNNIDNNINDGNYGDTSLQMEPQKLVRGDDNRKKFRCDAEWATTVGGQVYTARVGCESTLLLALLSLLVTRTRPTHSATRI